MAKSGVQVRPGGRVGTPQVQNRAHGRLWFFLFPAAPCPSWRKTPTLLAQRPASDPVAPPYVGDQLEKHKTGRGECCNGICFDLAGSAARGALDQGLPAAEPRVCWLL